jgi:hypothetical protein
MGTRRRGSPRAALAGSLLFEGLASGYHALNRRNSVCQPYDAVFVRYYGVVHRVAVPAGVTCVTITTVGRTGENGLKASGRE